LGSVNEDWEVEKAGHYEISMFHIYVRKFGLYSGTDFAEIYVHPQWRHLYLSMLSK